MKRAVPASFVRPPGRIDLQTGPQGPDSKRRIALAVRSVTAALALGLILLAVLDEPLLQADQMFGWFQGVLFATGVCLAALCLAPLSWNEKGLIVLISVGLSLVVAEFVLRTLLGPRF